MTVVVEDRQSYNIKSCSKNGEKDSNDHGISVTVATLFLLGALAGAASMAMPNAFMKAGWWAIPMVIIMAIAGGYTGIQLGWSWTILQNNWQEYNSHTRNPYPEIAYRAGGQLMKYFAQACVLCSMFGGGVAYIILASQSISHLLDDWFGISLDFCRAVVIVALCMLPFFFLGTPKDFWGIALGALLTTAGAIIFIIVGTFFDKELCKGKVTYPEVTPRGFISAYCTMSFAYGAHGAFPTIQHDMKRPEKFPIAVTISFIVLFIMYFPMPMLGYLVYGDTVQGTIDMNLSSKFIRDSIMVLITSHVLFAYFIVMSPVIQDFERVLRIPVHFSWKRICTRASMLSFSVFVALSLPDFNAILELVGGTSLAAIVYILPGPMYLMLRRKTQGAEMEHKVEVKDGENNQSTMFSHRSRNGANIMAWEYVVNGLVVLAGIVGALATIYGVVEVGVTLKRPCFLTNMLLDDGTKKNSSSGFHAIEHCWQSANETSMHDFML